MIKQAHVLITGKVVGVGFRFWVKSQANILNLAGWVKNNNDKVEAVFQGEEKLIKAMLLLIKNGPPLSAVKDIVVQWNKPEEDFNWFEIIR